MKRLKERFSKRILAVVCIVTLLVNACLIQAFAEDGDASNGTTTLTLAEFGITEAKTLYSDTASAYSTYKIDDTYLDGYAIEGYYNFSGGSQTNYLFVGGAVWGGFYITNATTDSIKFGYNSTMTAMDNGTLTSGALTTETYNANNGDATDLDSIMGRYLKIRLEYSIADTTVENTTVTIKMIINDVFENTFTVTGANPAHNKKSIVPYASKGNTFKIKPYEYDTLTLDKFGFNEAKTFISENNTSAYEQKTIDDNAYLDGCAIEGYYNFSGGSQSNYLFVGGAVWQGFYIANASTNSIKFGYNSTGTMNNGTLTSGTLTTDVYNANNGDAADLTNIIGQDLKIRLEYSIADTTATSTTVTIKMIINDVFENTFTVTGANPAHNKKSIVPYANQNSQFKIKPYQYETVSLTDFGFDEVVCFEKGNDNKQLSNSLNNYIVEGYYIFGQGDAGSSRLTFGNPLSGNWTGINIAPWNDGTTLIVYYGAGASPTNTTAAAMTKINLSDYNAASEVDLASFYAQELKISVKFSFDDPTSSSTGLKLDVKINDVYEQTISFTGVNASYMKGTLAIVSPGSGGVSILAKNAHQKVSLTDDIGIVEGTYYKGIDVDGQYTTGAPDYTACSLVDTGLTQNITFSTHAGTYINYAGQDHSSGIQFTVQEDGSIAIAAADGEFAETYSLTAEVAGVDSLLEADIKWELELYQAGDDVKLAIFINGEWYNNTLFTLIGAATKLGGFVRISVQDSKAYVSLGDEANVSFYDERVAYNLANSSENSYLISGEGRVKVNYDQLLSTDSWELTTPGDYFIYADGGTDENKRYAKWVSLFYYGDANADGTYDVRDLVAAKKQLANTGKVADSELKTPEDFGFGETQTFQADGASSLLKKQLDTSLHGYEIEGYYNFSGGTGNNRVWFGSGANNWKSFVIENKDGQSIRFGYYNCNTGTLSTGLEGDTLTPAIYNANNGMAEDVDKLIGRDLKIRVSFAYDDPTAADTTLRITVTINDAYVQQMTVTNANPSELVASLTVYSGYINGENAGPITVSSPQYEHLTWAESKGADANGDGTVNSDDMTVIRDNILNELTVSDAPKDSSESFGVSNVMPISGYLGPYATTDTLGKSYNLINQDIYQLIKDVGVNLVTLNNISYGEDTTKYPYVLENLALAEKNGIGVLVRDDRGGKDAASLSYFMKDFAAYSSFKGFSVIDEPYANYYYPTDWGTEWTDGEGKFIGKPRLSDYATQASVKNNYVNTIGYVNLLPALSHLTTDSDYKTVYQKYVNEYMTTYNPRLLSFDYYLYCKDRNREGYFDTLSIIRTAALNANIPFWTCIQAGDNFNTATSNLMGTTTNDNPSKGELLWNVNTSLAYGATGVQYFPLIQPDFFALETNTTYDYDRNGLIGAGVGDDGDQKTIWYDYAKNANTQIAEVDEVLMYAKNKEILAIGSTVQAETGVTQTGDSKGVLKSDNPVVAANGAIIGVFDYQGKTAFYVVNDDVVNSQTITLNFDGAKEYVVRSKQTASTTQGKTECTLELEAGGAALVIVE